MTSTLSFPNKSQIHHENHNMEEEEDSIDSSSIILVCIVIFGLVGNVISLVTIFHSRLRKTAANQYLIVLTLADSVFLFMLLMVAFKADYLSYEICVIEEYILMTSSYASSWSIAALTIERYIAIAHPLKQLRYGHVNRSKIMLYWVPIPFILNLVQFVNLVPSEVPHGRQCQVKSGTLEAIIEPADVFLCYLMPCLIVVILNLLVAAKVESSEKNFMKESQSETQGLSADFSRNSRRQGRLAAASAGSTRILLVVPVVYILLNTPFYLFRIADIVNRVLFDSEYLSSPDALVPGGMNPIVGQLLNIAHYLYYGNFACDVIVYAFSRMSDTRSGTSLGASPQLEKVLGEPQRPCYISAFTGFMRVCFKVYDAIVYLPFKIFSGPEKRLELSQRTKAHPTKERDPFSPWRHVDVIDKPLQTLVYPDCPTLGEMWKEAVGRYADSLCMGTRETKEVFEEVQPEKRKLQKLVLGEYEWIDYAEADSRIARIARKLKSLGLRKGTNVVIYAETRMEWLQTAIACFKTGLPVVTVYATLGEEAVAYAMKECDAVAVFTSFGLLEKVHAAVKGCPNILHVIYYSDLYQRSDVPQKANDSLEKLFTDIGRKLYDFDTILEMGDSGEEATVDVKPDDLAMIMYTSGTTGNPKGVMLSHKNIIAALAGQSAVIPVNEKDTYIGYLPLAHILEVCAEIICLSKGCRIGYSSAQTLHDRAQKIKKGSKGDCAMLKPTLIACVPAILDRIFKAVTDEVNQKSPISRELFRICCERKQARYKDGYKSPVMNKFVFKRIRQLLGGKIRCILSGGAPLNRDTQRFINVCFCCPVVQGYGLTETCGGATLADVFDLSTGTVGPPLRCCEIMLREWPEAGYSPANNPPRGEILIHGDNVALGYYKNQEKTREDFIEINGKRWFASGDIGEFRADGSLLIIDRKKDLIKLAHGEYVSLARVETMLLTNLNIDNICVHGSSHHAYLIAIVVPNQNNLEQLAEKNGIKSGSFEELCKDKRVCDLVGKAIKDHVTGKLQRVEIPQKIFLHHEPWTPASGLLTEALKLKRKNIEKEFESEIAALYSEE